MTADTTTPRSRRALLAGSLGALAAVAAQAIARPLPASAGGGAVMLGADNKSSNSTRFIRADDTTMATLAGGDSGVTGLVSMVGGAGIFGYSGSGSGSI